eukprot:gene6531-biopygen13723
MPSQLMGPSDPVFHVRDRLLDPGREDPTWETLQHSGSKESPLEGRFLKHA